MQSTHSVRVQELEQQLGAMDARMATELAKVGALREALAAAQVGIDSNRELSCWHTPHSSVG